ncbi:MAG TPA: nucleotide exchange factor GrpE [Patescibacteria group bacterium]|nr:nucleotide exchange factor GrpE [Patescibacteria group bacterium]
MKTTPDDMQNQKNEKKQDVEKQKDAEKDCCGDLEASKKEIENWREKYIRALADYQNLERRTGNEFAHIRSQVHKRLLGGFLDIMDDLEKAEVFVKDTGLQLVKNKFSALLQKEGVRELVLVGTLYDPHTAECIEIVEGDHDNIIIEIVQKGYALDSKIIRVARVKVAKKKK